MFSIESLASVNGNSAVSHTNGHSTVAKSVTIIFLWYVCDQLTCSSNHPPVWVICLLITKGWPTWGDLLLYTIRYSVWAVLLQWSKMAGWGNIVSGVYGKSVYIKHEKAFQLSYKAGKSCQVFVLLYNSHVFLFFGNFTWIFFVKVVDHLAFG